MASSENSSSADYVSGSPVNSTEGKTKKSQVQFSKDEEALIVRMHKLVGERWSLIAGRIPGRTAEEIKDYWMSRYSTSDFGK